MARGATAQASGGAGRSGERERTETPHRWGVPTGQLWRYAGSLNGDRAARSAVTGSMNGLFSVKNFLPGRGEGDGGELERTEMGPRGSLNGRNDGAGSDVDRGAVLTGSMNGGIGVIGGELERTTTIRVFDIPCSHPDRHAGATTNFPVPVPACCTGYGKRKREVTRTAALTTSSAWRCGGRPGTSPWCARSPCNS